MLARMLQRRGTAAQWEDVKNTVILAAGEIGLETDTGKFKVGDGVTVWNNLSYYLRDSDNDDIYSKLVASQTFTGTQTLSPANATSIPLEVRGVDAQSAKLQRWRVGIGAPVEVASIDAAGKITATGGVFNDDVSLAGNLITNVATPVTGTDAANKQYVDDVAAGISWKDPVNLISASGLNTYINVALTGNTGTLVLDGHAALDSGDSGYRILLIGQTTASENGIYVYNDNGTTYTLTRSTDADSFQELDGASVFVSEGTNYGTSSWVQTNHYLDSFSGQTWVQFNGASQIVADGGLTKVGNTLAVGAGDGIQVNPDSIQIAAGGVTSGMIANGAIVNDDVSATAAIAATKISGTAVTQADTGTVSTTMLANDSVTNDKLADNSVGIENMQNESVGTAELADGAVTSAKILNGTIVNDDINAAAAIEQSKIANLTTDLSNKSDITHTHTLDNLSDVTITAPPADRQVLKYKGAPVNAWINELPSGGISIGATPPADASSGDAWFDSTDGSLYVYYNDGVDNDGAGPGTSSQWVQVKANSALEGSILTRLSAVEARNTQIEGANAIRVTSMAQRDSVYPAPVQGNTVFRADLGYEEKYYAAYNATTNPDGTTGTIGWYRYAGGAPLSENKIINGAFDIWQRGTSFSFSGASGQYTADRFAFYTDGTGATVTVSQQTFTPGTAPVASTEGKFFARINRTAAGTGGTYSNFQQAIEDVRSFAGQTVSLSFWAKADASRTITAFMNQDFGTGGSSAVPTASQSFSVTTSWQKFTATFTLPSVSGKTISSTDSKLWAYISTPNVISYIDIWGVQVEQGPVATPFRRNQPNIQAELAACQRYYWRTGYGDLTGASFATPLAQANNYSGTQIECIVQFPVQMRKYPALDMSSVSNQFRFYRNSGSDDFTSFTLGATSSLFAELYNTTEISGTAGQAGFVMFNVAGSYVGFSAEL